MSLHFYNDKEDNNKEESINNYADFFLEYIENPPSLESALQQMFTSSGLTIQKSVKLIQEIISKADKLIKQNLNKIRKKYPLINENDIKIISSYTCESFEPGYSPYKILNRNLVSENRQLGIRNVSKYLFIFLKSLRKLDKFYPDSKFLYRCIREKVKLNYNKYNPKLVPYIAGNIKTFWAFTSTSPNAKETFNFLKKDKYKNDNNKTGTIFTLTGKYGDMIFLYLIFW